MIIRLHSLSVPHDADLPRTLRYKIEQRMGTHASLLRSFKIVRRSIDARKGRVSLVFSVDITVDDEISITFIAAGLAWSFINPELSLVSSVAGALAGGGSLWLTGIIYKKMRKVDGMGGGDVKLMAMIGAFLGIGLVLPVIVIASFLGSIYGLTLMRKGGDGQTAVAFGSFLAPAAAFCMVFGPALLAWYFGRF